MWGVKILNSRPSPSKGHIFSLLKADYYSYNINKFWFTLESPPAPPHSRANTHKISSAHHVEMLS